MAVGEVMGAKPHHQHPQSIKYLRLENDKLRRMVKCTDIQELQAENNGTMLANGSALRGVRQTEAIETEANNCRPEFDDH